MKFVLYFLFLLISVLPGVLLFIGAKRLKRNTPRNSGNLVLLGSVLLLLSLISGTGTWLFSSFGTAEDLAAFAKINVWVEGITKYIGLLCLGIGLLLFRPKKNSLD